MKRTLFFIISLCSLLVLSCSQDDLVSPSSEEQKTAGGTQGTYCSFHIAVSDGTARQVVPRYDVTSLYYNFSYCADGESEMHYYPSETGAIDYDTFSTHVFTLLTGTYSFNLVAYSDSMKTADVLIYTEMEYNLAAGTTSLSFAMTEPTENLSSRMGAISVPVTFPAAANIASVSAKLVSVAAPATPVDEQTSLAVTDMADGRKKVTYTANDIAVGMYILFITLTDSDGKTVSIPEMVKVASGVTSKPDTTGNPTGELVLSERQTNVRYSIDYKNMDDGNGTDYWEAGAHPLSFISGTTVTLPASTSVFKDGFVFKGWYENSDFSGSPVTSIAEASSNITVYAKWADACATIAVTKNGTTTKTACETLSDTVSAIQNASSGSTIAVTLGGTVTNGNLGNNSTSGTIAYAIKKTSCDAVSLDMSMATGITTLNDGASSSDWIFYSCQKLVSVKLPSRLTRIPKCMFGNCVRLESVSIPASVTTISRCAFGLNGTSVPAVLSSVTFEDWDDAYRWEIKLTGMVTHYRTNITPAMNALSIKTLYNYEWTKISSATILLGMKPGSDINEVLLALGADSTATAFMPSTTAPTGEIIYYLDNADADIPVWLSGTTIYYYCENYTDGENKKLPLNADSSRMFSVCSSLVSIDLSGFDTSAVTDMSSMFKGCSKLTALDVSHFVTTNVTTMSSMFAGCTKLHSVDVSGFDTANVMYMSYMFQNCETLETLDVSSWNTGNVTLFTSLFSGCTSLKTLDVSGWNTEKVGNMTNMFYNCSKLTSLDLIGWNTTSLTNMSSLFYRCSGITSLSVDGWNTGSVTDMSSVFYGCNKLTSLDLSGWNTENVTTMASLFSGCSALATLNVRGWNTEKVGLMAGMFNGCSKLTTIYVSDTFTTAAVTSSTDMFNNCTSLVGGKGTAYNSSNVTATYARIDDGTDAPGYFTDKDVLYVSSTGTAAGDGLRTNPCATLAQAVGKVNAEGKTQRIYVSGEISGNTAISTLKADLLIIEGITADASLVGDGTSSVLSVTSSTRVTISGLTITGGSAECGGGLYLDGANLTLSDGAVITGNTATINGGGVFVGGSGSLRLSGGTISGNTSLNGGGIYNGGTVFLSGTAVIGSNSATNSGGGVYNSGGTVYLSGSSVIGSLSADTAPASGSSVETVIAAGGNYSAAGGSSGEGGGIYSSGGKIYLGYTDADTPDASFTGGICANYSAMAAGGVSLASKAELYMSGGNLSYNRSKNGGGAVKTAGSAVIRISGGTVTGNRAGGSGGGIYIGSAESFYMTGGIVSDNEGTGGGVYSNGGTFSIGGNAYIPVGESGKNVVYLVTAAKITLASPLTSTKTVATITPASYTEGKEILVLAADCSESLAAGSAKFAVTPNGTQTWTLDTEGKLAKSTGLDATAMASFEPTAGESYNFVITGGDSEAVNEFIRTLCDKTKNTSSTLIGESVLDLSKCDFAVAFNSLAIKSANSVIPQNFTTVILPAVTDPSDIQGFRFKNAFQNVQEVIVPSGATKLYVEDGVVYSKDKTQLVWYPASKEGESYTVLPTVTTINAHAVEYAKNLKTMILPDGLKTINSDAFYQAKIEYITIPEGVVSIYDEVFCNCAKLQTVSLPSTLTTLSIRAFGYCSLLKTVNIPSKLTNLYDDAFVSCSSLQSITIPAGITSIYRSSFSGCTSLTSVVFENTSGWTDEDGNAVTVDTPAAGATAVRSGKTLTRK